MSPGRLLRAAHARLGLAAASDPALVVAAGKAAWSMAAAFAECTRPGRVEGIIAGPRPADAEPPAGFEWLDAGHPYPNAASARAGTRALALARRAGPEAPLVVLLSGGASALLVSPVPGVTVPDKVAAARALMEAGAAIDALNCVRKHLSAVKGGRLGALAGHSLTLAISDVHGPIADDPSVIGSGPTVADPTTFDDALAAIRAVHAAVPAAVLTQLERGARGEIEESIKPGSARLATAAFEIIGNRMTALEGAAGAARARGYTVIVIEEPVHGEARIAGPAFVERSRQLAAGASRPACVLAAGETTVRVVGAGLGGRNQELVLAGAPLLAMMDADTLLASAGTDGIDGPTDAAGAMADASTMDRARRIGLDPAAYLAANDAYRFFEPLGDLILSGPTGTNVGDLLVFLQAERMHP